MNKFIETYTDDAHRNRRKQNRRRAALDAMAKAAGWVSWSKYETAVKDGRVTIEVMPDTHQ